MQNENHKQAFFQEVSKVYRRNLKKRINAFQAGAYQAEILKNAKRGMISKEANHFNMLLHRGTASDEEAAAFYDYMIRVTGGTPEKGEKVENSSLL